MKHKISLNAKKVISLLLSIVMTITMFPNLWLTIHAEIVRNEIILSLTEDNQATEGSSSDDNAYKIIKSYAEDYELYGTDSSAAPDGYIPEASTANKSKMLRSLLNVDDVTSKVLLIEDTLPWRTSTNSNVLTALGIAFEKVTTNNFLTTDLGEFSVIIFANDQQISTYNNYAGFKKQIEEFAELGGVVVFGACDAGWASGSLNSVLPGEVSKKTQYESRNYIVNSDHPIVTGVLSDGKALTNNMLYGNFCSHVMFYEDTLPEGATVILRETTSNMPTLVEYPFGKGVIIASGLTW